MIVLIGAGFGGDGGFGETGFFLGVFLIAGCEVSIGVATIGLAENVGSAGRTVTTSGSCVGGSVGATGTCVGVTVAVGVAGGLVGLDVGTDVGGASDVSGEPGVSLGRNDKKDAAASNPAPTAIVIAPCLVKANCEASDAMLCIHGLFPASPIRCIPP